MKFADILEADDLAHEDLNVPEWGGTIRVTQLAADGTMDMTECMSRAPQDGLFVIVVFTARDPETNTPVFPLPDAGEERVAKIAEYVAVLRKKNFQVLTRLQQAALRVNRMGVRTEERKNA